MQTRAPQIPLGFFLLFSLLGLLVTACGQGTGPEGCPADCPTGHCLDNACVACVLDAECGEGSCHGGECFLAQACSDSGVCPEEISVCAAGSCVECESDLACGVGSGRCLSGRCSSPCERAADCTGGEVCDEGLGSCVQCSTDAHCPASFHCASYRCAPDGCQPGATRCAQEGNAVMLCAGDGRQWVPSFCDDRTTCGEGPDGFDCLPWVCEPGARRCSDDDKFVLQCALDGLKDEEPLDCSADGGVCHDGACEKPTCKPGKEFCSGGAIHLCNETGAESSLVESCNSGEYCDAKTVECKPQTCTANAEVCDGNIATQCASDGSALLQGTDCAAQDQVCYDGECRDVVCSGTYVCVDGDNYVCSQDGTFLELLQECSPEDYYYCQEGLPYCQVDACTGGEDYCSGNVAFTCKPDGSGPVDAGTDCGGDVCLNGSCEPQICTAYVYSCSAGNVVRCNGSGTGTDLIDTCLSSEFCQSGTATCKGDLCLAGSTSCSGDNVVTCKADGSGPVDAGTPCGDQNCLEGACLPVICTTDFCQGGHPQYCTNNGTAIVQWDTCSAAEYCLEGSTTCQPDVCTGGAGVCVGTKIASCKADGSGPVDAGADCPDGDACRAGACRDIICTPAAYSCVANTNGNRVICDGTGTEQTASTSCAAGDYCDPGTGNCVVDRCSPGTAACSGETRATCNTFGSGYTSPSTDCSATAQVCTFTGCAAAAEDGSVVSGTSYSPSPAVLFFHKFRADKDRSITKLATQVSLLSTASTITWVVYESQTAASGFYSIHSSLTTPGVANSMQLFDSGAISVPLVAGRYYMIGAYITQAQTSQYTSATIPSWVSFGTFLGGNVNAYASLPSSPSASVSTYRFSLLVTTGLAQ